MMQDDDIFFWVWGEGVCLSVWYSSVDYNFVEVLILEKKN